MSIFSAGIVWDSREPLPLEYAAAVPPVVNLAAVGRQNRPTVKHYLTLPEVVKPAVQTKSLPSAVVQESGRNVLPAVSVSISARITGDVAEVTVRQLFWNDGDSPIHKGSYTFSLPNGCTVMGFTCRIGNSRVLTATARPKAEAQEEFQQAVASHATAALLDQNTPEIYTSSIGNIPPNTRVNTEIKYATILQHRYGSDTNITTLTIPTYIANRYGQRPANLEGLDLEARPGDISLRIEIFDSAHIHSIQSDSHEISVDRGTTSGQALSFAQIGKGSKDNRQETAIITLKETTSWMDTDFVLSLNSARSKGSESPEALLEMHPTFEDQSAIMVTIPPQGLPVQKEILKTGEIIFLADRSGSMEDKMINLRSAMHFFLKGLPVGHIFNIWCFGSDYERLWNESRMYDEESLRFALDYVDSRFHADLGGTEILPALEAVIAARDGSLPCDVIVLTDGQVWRLDETLSLVRKARNYSNGAIRFFSLGLGAHVSHALVGGIAQEGGGCSEVIPQAGKDGWETRMIRILTAALTTHIHDLRLDLNGLKAITAPTNLEFLNPFQAHRIFLLLEQGSTLENDKISLTFVIDGKRMLVNPATIKIDKPGTLIHNLSARAILDNLEREASSASYLSETNLQTQPGQARIQRLAEDIACRYTLPSRWTSLFLLHREGEVSGGEAGSITTRSIGTSRIEHASLLNHRGILMRAERRSPDGTFRLGISYNCTNFTNICEMEGIATGGIAGGGIAKGGTGKSKVTRIIRSLLPHRPNFGIAGLPNEANHDSEMTPNIGAAQYPTPINFDDIITSLSRLLPSIWRASPGRDRRSCPSARRSYPGPPTPEDPRYEKNSAKEEFISHILKHQAFDGSIGRKALDDLPCPASDGAAALKAWLAQRTKLDDDVLNRVATTAAIARVLERDYKRYEDLWTRMWEKGLEYIHLHLAPLNLEEEFLGYSRSTVNQLSEKVTLQRKASSSISSEDIKKQHYADKTNHGSPESNRVLVHGAPIDD